MTAVLITLSKNYVTNHDEVLKKLSDFNLGGGDFNLGWQL